VSGHENLPDLLLIEELVLPCEGDQPLILHIAMDLVEVEHDSMPKSASSEVRDHAAQELGRHGHTRFMLAS